MAAEPQRRLRPPVEQLHQTELLSGNAGNSAGRAASEGAQADGVLGMCFARARQFDVVDPDGHVYSFPLSRSDTSFTAAALAVISSIAERSFIAAGAVVTRDIPPRSFVVGVPGRIKPLPADLDRANHRQLTIQIELRNFSAPEPSSMSRDLYSPYWM